MGEGALARRLASTSKFREVFCLIPTPNQATHGDLHAGNPLLSIDTSKASLRGPRHAHSAPAFLIPRGGIPSSNLQCKRLTNYTVGGFAGFRREFRAAQALGVSRRLDCSERRLSLGAPKPGAHARKRASDKTRITTCLLVAHCATLS